MTQPRPLLSPSFVALITAQACFGFAFSCYFLLPTFLATRLGAGPAQIGLVVATFGATTVVLGPLMGALVDRRGRRRFLTAGALVMVLSSLAFATVDAFGPLVFALRVVQGAAFAMAFVAGSAMAVDEAPPERLAQALGIFGLTFLAMNAVAPAVAEEIALRAGWSWVFGLAAAMAFVSALLSRRVRESARPAPDEPVPGLWAVVREPRFLRIALVIGLAGVAFAAMFNFHQPFAIELGIRRVRAFFVAYTLAAVSVRLGLGPFVDRAGRHRVCLAALAVYGLATLAMARLDRFGLAPIGAVFGLAHGLLYPSLNALAVDGSGVHERGKRMALFNGAFNLGGTGGALALGFAAEAAGFPAVFVLAGAGALLALAVLALSPEGRGASAVATRRPSPPAPRASAFGGS